MRRAFTSTARRAVATAVALAAFGGAGLAVAGPAGASTDAERDGYCDGPDLGELCLYYDYDYTGPVFDMFWADNKFKNDRYPTSPTVSPNNNSRSWWNQDYLTWYVYKKNNYAGSSTSLAPGSYGNFSSPYVDSISSATF